MAARTRARASARSRSTTTGTHERFRRLHSLDLASNVRSTSTPTTRLRTVSAPPRERRGPLSRGRTTLRPSRTVTATRPPTRRRDPVRQYYEKLRKRMPRARRKPAMKTAPLRLRGRRRLRAPTTRAQARTEIVGARRLLGAHLQQHRPPRTMSTAATRSPHAARKSRRRRDHERREERGDGARQRVETEELRRPLRRRDPRHERARGGQPGDEEHREDPIGAK